MNADKIIDLWIKRGRSESELARIIDLSLGIAELEGYQEGFQAGLMEAENNRSV